MEWFINKLNWTLIVQIAKTCKTGQIGIHYSDSTLLKSFPEHNQHKKTFLIYYTNTTVWPSPALQPKVAIAIAVIWLLPLPDFLNLFMK